MIQTEFNMRAWDSFNGVMYSKENLCDFFKDIVLLDEGDNGLTLLLGTGKPDKTGKEVFQGDILELLSHDCQKIPSLIYSEVYYDAKNARFETRVINKNPLFKIGADLGIYDESRIVGNIFENKDLLKP